jgi:hypothetical protein
MVLVDEPRRDDMHLAIDNETLVSWETGSLVREGTIVSIRVVENGNVFEQDLHMPSLLTSYPAIYGNIA